MTTFYTYPELTPERIASELEVIPEELSKAMATLVLLGLVLRRDTAFDGTTGWMLSSVWGRKGSYREVQADIAVENDRRRDAA
jgi:hypothetical protein